MENAIKEILLTQAQIDEKITQMGEQITKDYAGKRLLMISVLKGSCVFMSDLMRKINIPLSIDFIYVSSYGSGTQTSGNVKIIKDLDINIEGRDVLIVEDILDSGVTLSSMMELMQTRGAASIKLAALLNKPERRKVDIKLDYEGFVIPDEFVVGYGLDFDETYRNLPYIGILKEEVYN